MTFVFLLLTTLFHITKNFFSPTHSVHKKKCL